MRASLPPPPPGRSGWPWIAPAEETEDPGITADLPSITIVTPSYNQADFLEETVRSVLCQDYPRLHYIVVDGGSTDTSKEILQRYDDHLTWLSEPDQGQADAVNKGLQRSSGDVLGWLNSDDVLLPGALLRVGRAFAARQQAEVVCGFRRYIDERSRVTHNGVHEVPTKKTLQHYCYVAQETVYWRRHVWAEVGGLDVSYRYALDFEYWHRMLAAGFTFELIPEFLACFRLHDQSKGSLMDDVREQEMRRVYETYLAKSASFADMKRALGAGWALRWSTLRALRDTGIFEEPGRAAGLLRLLRPLRTRRTPAGTIVDRRALATR